MTALLLAWAVWSPAATAGAQDGMAGAESAAWDRGTGELLGTPWDRGTPWDAERAWEEMERMRHEIRVLSGLAEAQAALLAWNRERAESGAGPAVLPALLCAEAMLGPWCRTLVHTFGAEAGKEAEDGEP